MHRVHLRTFPSALLRPFAAALLLSLCPTPSRATSTPAPGTQTNLQEEIFTEGTYASPRGWSGSTNVGAIHYYKGMFFESKVNGDPSTNNWYFPTTPTSNAYWEYLDTPVTWIVTSDPQYPWTEKTDSGQAEDDVVQEERSRQFISAQYRSIEAYRRARPDAKPFIPVIINGDMTAFGHGWQISWMKSLLNQGLPGGHYYFGLGNHDYENNVNDCANNGCARDSMQWLMDHMDASGAMLKDYDVYSGVQYLKYTGSFSYAIPLGPVWLIQTNYRPGYERTFSSGTPPFEKKREFVVEKSTGRLGLTLWLAKLVGAVPIINSHHPDPGTDVASIMKTGNVPAVFSGHYHKEFGDRSSSYSTAWGGASVFMSSSPIYGQYLISEYYPKQGILRVYGVTGNAPEKKRLLKEIDWTPAPFEASETLMKEAEAALSRP